MKKTLLLFFSKSVAEYFCTPIIINRGIRKPLVSVPVRWFWPTAEQAGAEDGCETVRKQKLKRQR